MKKQSCYGLAFALVPLGALVILLTLKQTGGVLGEDGRMAVAKAAENPTPKPGSKKAWPFDEVSFVDKRAEPAAPAPLTRRQPGNLPRGGGVPFLTGPVPGDALDVALKYVRSPENRPGYTGEDFNDPKISSRYVSKHNGVTHIFLRQQHQGIEVYGADIGVNLMPDGRIVNLHNGFVTDLAAEVNGTEPVITAQEAIRSAAEFYKLNAPGPLNPLEVAVPDPVAKKQLFSPAGISLDPIPAKLTYVPLEEGVTRLAWNMVIRFADSERWLDLNVDAETGKVLSEANWIADAAYNVYPIPLESPSDGGRSVQTDPQNPAASPFGWHDTNGVSGAEFTETRGNNVNAQEDADNNNSGGARPSGGASLDFNFPADLGQAPATYIPAVTTNLFYWNNIIHDIFWQYGFDEAAGNFQENNYGNGGAASDPVEADSQDGSGTNNANFGTPPDGSNPRMQMYIWTGPTPDRDSSFDSGIIIHEYGHGISNRLTGGPANSSALNASQSRGMGEGWSDFLGLALTHQAGDTGPIGRGIGTYVLGQPPTGAGIRPFRYSTDLAVNPQHFGNLNGGGLSVPHGIGSVWCTTLWELYWALVGVHGYNSDIYNGTGGNNMALQLVIDGMKLQPANPSFLDARDAIITADEVNNSGANFLTIWTAFAKRGMGYSAYDGGSSSSLAVVAAYDLPDDLNITPDARTPFVSTGKPGGPFVPSSQTYTLENTGGASLTWTASDNVSWLDLSVASGTLAAAATTPVNATINANANSLGLGTHTATVSFTNTISGATIARSVSLSVNDLAEALDSPSLTFGTSGNLPWFYETTTTQDGVDAAQSGAITHDQSSSVETTLTGPGTMTFWWKVSSESGWDFLRFYLNGVEQGGSLARISGTVDWVQKTVSIPAGSQTVRWSYTKDGSVNTGSDAGWLDQVVYTPASAPEIVVEQPVGTILVDGSATIDFGSVNVGSSSSPVTFTIRNAGNVDLTGLALSMSGTNDVDYTLGTLGATTLAPGISTTFTVTFAPGAAGSRTAAIQIASNDADENPFDINLTGTGVGPGTLAVTPAGGLASSGTYGGTFSPPSVQYTLSNPGSTSIDWTSAKSAGWVGLDATSGTLAPGADTTVTVSIDATASSLNVGGYSDTVSFTNTTSATGNTTRGVSLTVNPIAASVNLSGLLQTYDGSPKSITVTTTPSGLSHSVTYDGSATAPTNAGTYGVVATVTEPNYQGSASGNLVIAHTVSYQGNGNTSGTVPADQTKFQGVDLALATNSGNLNKTGFSFVGWNTTADGSGTEYPAGAIYSGNASLTLYAKWAPGADGTWSQTTAGPFDWGTAGNWSGETVASGADRTAFFTPNISAAQTVNLESARTIGNITFTDSISSHDLTISGTNVLNLVRTSGMPTITATNRTLTVSSQISGNNGLQKDGTGTLTLTGPNSFSGGLVMNTGTVSVTTASLNSNAITVNGTSTLIANTSDTTSSSGITLSNGINLSIGTSSRILTVNGAVTGSGALTVNNSGGTGSNVKLLSSGNDFTGQIWIGPSANQNINTQTLTVNSLGDSASAITFGYGNTTLTANEQIFSYTGSSALILNNRYFEFGPVATTGVNGSGTIEAAGATAAATLTILKDLVVSGTGSGITKKLTLKGSNTGNNAFAGNIADGIGTSIAITKAGSGTWVLSGTNTYSGTTVNTFSNPASGSLTFQGIQSLPNGTTLQQTHGGGVGGFGVIKILDDSATPASRSGTNIAMLASNTSHTMSIFVGNNNTANGGTSSGTTMGSTIQLGNLTLTQNAASNNTSQSLAVTGGNGYRLQIGGVAPTMNASYTGIYTAVLNPTTAPLTVAGNVQQTSSGGVGSTVTLSLDGTASGNLISGNVMDGADGKLLRVTKSSAGTWVLTGSNTYTGLTTISGGTLQLGDGTPGKDGSIDNSSGITNNATLVFNRHGNLSSSVAIIGSGAVTKTGSGSQTLTGTNTYSGLTTVSAGKLFINGSLSNVNVAFTVNPGTTLGGTGTVGRNVTIAAGGKLEFELSTAAGSHDRLDISSGRSFAFGGASELTITSASGASPGIYTLISGGNNITGSAPATVNLPTGWAATVSISGNSLLLNVTSTGGPGPVDHFAISAIGSPQTVGTPITGITITAQDSSNATASGFNGTVSFGGTGGFTGTSAAFTAGVLTGVSVTPTVAGAGLTFTVTDGASPTPHTGTTTITTIQTKYAAWAGASAFDGDANGDGVKDGLAWVLGAANPNVNAIGLLPTLAAGSGNMVFSFKRSQASINANTALTIEVGTTLGTWPSTYTVGSDTASSSTGVTVAKDSPAAGTDTVTLSVTQAPDTKKFTRLKVVQTP